MDSSSFSAGMMTATGAEGETETGIQSEAFLDQDACSHSTPKTFTSKSPSRILDDSSWNSTTSRSP